MSTDEGVCSEQALLTWARSRGIEAPRITVGQFVYEDPLAEVCLVGLTCAIYARGVTSSITFVGTHAGGLLARHHQGEAWNPCA